MLKICINRPLSYVSLFALLLSGCGAFSSNPQPDVTPQVKQAYQRALNSMNANKHRQAIKQFIKISKASPSLAGPHTNLGILYIKTNSLQQAEHSLQRAIELNAQNRIAHNYLGIVYRQQGQFDDAEKAYLKAIEVDSNYGYAHLNLGILYDLYKSDLQKALAHYQKFQNLTNKPDKMVEKWIVDIKRRDTANNHLQENKG